jgi:hypothetical protein
VLFGVNPLSPRIEMPTVVFALVGAVLAMVACNNQRGPPARGRGF